MMGSLPRGLFSIRRSSGFSTVQIYSLIKICEDLYRNIVILTDIPVEREAGASPIVSLNPDLSKGELFDYTFSCGMDGEEEDALSSLSDFIYGKTWKCWMPNRDGEIPFQDALVKAERIMGIGFDCACIPSVAVKLGPLRDMFISKNGPITSVMIPNRGEGFWREIFRSSGFYGASAGAFVERAV